MQFVQIPADEEKSRCGITPTLGNLSPNRATASPVLTRARASVETLELQITRVRHEGFSHSYVKPCIWLAMEEHCVLF